MRVIEIFPDSRIVSALRRQLSWTSIKTIIYIGQKWITVDNEDYYIDLLFYHRRLKCLVAIDLKLGKFKAAYKGQMENAILLELEKFIIEFGNGFAFMERQKRIIIGSIQ
ncbi:hypothetical protein FACS1894161_3400 [Spirochaetia bacterium]|nr:hypothetical protein FACS1894161_3400 [Spirochaetia bacterium]